MHLTFWLVTTVRLRHRGVGRKGGGRRVNDRFGCCQRTRLILFLELQSVLRPGTSSIYRNMDQLQLRSYHIWHFDPAVPAARPGSCFFFIQYSADIVNLVRLFGLCVYLCVYLCTCSIWDSNTGKSKGSVQPNHKTFSHFPQVVSIHANTVLLFFPPPRFSDICPLELRHCSNTKHGGGNKIWYALHTALNNTFKKFNKNISFQWMSQLLWKIHRKKPEQFS